MKVSILGTDYTIEFATESDDKILADIGGYCDFYAKKIVIDKSEDGNIHDFKRWRNQALRHEIVHAFLFESGLSHNSAVIEAGWSTNEEMVDFFAIQGEKIYKAWSEVNALD